MDLKFLQTMECDEYIIIDTCTQAFLLNDYPRLLAQGIRRSRASGFCTRNAAV